MPFLLNHSTSIKRNKNIFKIGLDICFYFIYKGKISHTKGIDLPYVFKIHFQKFKNTKWEIIDINPEFYHICFVMTFFRALRILIIESLSSPTQPRTSKRQNKKLHPFFLWVDILHLYEIFRSKKQKLLWDFFFIIVRLF